MILAEAGYDQSRHDAMVQKVKAQPDLTIEDAISNLVEGYCELYNFTESYQINHGMCEDFAEDVKSLFPDAETWWDDELDAKSNAAHKVVLYQGRYYDAELPQGHEDWRQLPYFLRLDE